MEWLCFRILGARSRWFPERDLGNDPRIKNVTTATQNGAEPGRASVVHGAADAVLRRRARSRFGIHLMIFLDSKRSVLEPRLERKYERGHPWPSLARESRVRPWTRPLNRGLGYRSSLTVRFSNRRGLYRQFPEPISSISLGVSRLWGIGSVQSAARSPSSAGRAFEEETVAFPSLSVIAPCSPYARCCCGEGGDTGSWASWGLWRWGREPGPESA
jgi:hypothetical protein